MSQFNRSTRLSTEKSGFLGNFLSKGLKTNQLEVNTDEKTLRPIARLKEPRELFALPKDKDNDCAQQAPRWPIECQVLDERMKHIPYVSSQPEPYNIPTGDELKPRPVGEENGMVVFNYNPISAVNYEKSKNTKLTRGDSSDSDISSSESTPDVRAMSQKSAPKITDLLEKFRTAQSPSDDEDDDDDDDDDDDAAAEDIWAGKSPEYPASTPTSIRNRFAKTPAIGIADVEAIPFSRSAVGGSKFLTNCHPYNADEYDGLEFESRFESGNLAKAVRITPTYYELYLRPDLYTSRSKQWFYFRVKKTRKNIIYRFSIVNLVKSDSLYNDGMRPLMYSTTNAKEKKEGWRRCGKFISYFRNEEDRSASDDDEENCSYTLTFNIEFEHDQDTVFFAHSYPYTYSDLQDYLMNIQKDPEKSKFCKLRLLCRSLAGNNVYYLTVTAPTADEEAAKRKKSIVVSARVHPSETPASWMMKGLMDFITGDTMAAKRLRHKFIFKLIPMLNPDGVIVGNTRNSLTGKDLNRQYRTVIRETYPSIWYTKAMIKRLIDECGVSMYCDMHAHSRKHNIFIYGCENKRNPEKKLTEQVFPLMMHKNVADKFSFEGCKFKVQRSKEGTGRIVVWLLGITNSYTIEASFGGTSLGSRKGTHFNTADYEHIGRAFCETLLDYSDENPIKVKRKFKLLKQIKRIRKRERRDNEIAKLRRLAEQERLRLKIIERLLKEGSSADEPLNIPLSDYSSDEGNTSTSSENEGKFNFNKYDLEGPCCAPLRAPPCTPENTVEFRKFNLNRMRKIMHELDRIYFQPKFKRQFGKKRPKRFKSRLHNSRERGGEDASKIKQHETKENSKAVTSDHTGAVELPSSDDEDSEDSDEEEIGIPTPNDGKTKATLIRRNRKKQEAARKFRVSRLLREWLLTRNIMIYRKGRKIKIRSKSSYSQRRKSDQRVPLDMPTTDPGTDIHFSTDDELCMEEISTPGGNMPRVRRNLLKSELQRRYIEEMNKNMKFMPPELIVTSPSKTTGAVPTKLTLKTAPAKATRSEFPMIEQLPKRTNSWHSINSTARRLPKVRPQNHLQLSASPYTNNDKDNLQLLLSLKKKVWNVVQRDGSATNTDSIHPLAWGAQCSGPQYRQQISRLRWSPPFRTEEPQSLFNACSQKLLAWQQSMVPRKTPNRYNGNSNVEVTELYETQKQTLGKDAPKNNPKAPTPKVELIEKSHSKRKNQFASIAETTQLMVRTTKKKSRSSTPAASRNIRAIPSKQIKPIGSNHKFKTGGIVATAVQPLPKRKMKKTRTLPAKDDVAPLEAVSSSRKTASKKQKPFGALISEGVMSTQQYEELKAEGPLRSDS